MTVTERILYLVKEKNMKPAEVSAKTGIDKTSFTRWKNANYKPSIDAIIELSQFFGVSTDWILKGDSTMNEHILSQDQKWIAKKFERLNERNKGRIFERIEILLEQQTESIDSDENNIKK